MARHGVIVRRLNAIEDFGSMNVLCSDKTGTLTKGVVQLHGALDAHGEPSEAVLLALLNSHFETGLAQPLDAPWSLRPNKPVSSRRYVKVDEVPYDFIRKRLSVVVEHGSRVDTADDHQGRAAERAQGLRSHPRRRRRRSRWMPIARRSCRHFAEYSEQGYRVLGVAVRT